MAAERRASVTWNGDLMGGSGTIDEVGSGAFGPLDVSWAARSEEASGGKTSPEELIAAAHASCFSMALSNVPREGGQLRRSGCRPPRRHLRAGNGDHEERAHGAGRSARASTRTASAQRPRTRRRTARSRRRWPASPRSRSTPSSSVAAPAPRPVVGALAEPGADRVRQHVVAGRLEVLVVAHLPEREAVSPEMAGARVLRVEVLGVEAVDAVQRARERVAGALDDEVVVVRHQAEGVDVQAEAGRRHARAERGTRARRRGRGRPAGARRRASSRARRRSRETSTGATEPSDQR